MRTLFLRLCILLTVAACSSETGIVIETSADSDIADTIHSLRYYVGRANIPNSVHHLSDNESATDIVLNGQDIAAKPYKLLLQASSGDMREFLVAAVALDEWGSIVAFGVLETPISFADGKVHQWKLALLAPGPSVFVTESDCLKWELADGEYMHIGTADDEDCDGVPAGSDCDDTDPARSPEFSEICDNGIDDDCNELADAADNGDQDEDGYPACGPEGDSDCDDGDKNIHPEALEKCDGIDNNCDGFCDEGYDNDTDTVTTCGSVIEVGDYGSRCIARGDDDCNDDDDRMFPGNEEHCDGLDNDCNGVCEDARYLDPDEDGYTACGSRYEMCGKNPLWIDCAPDDSTRHPGAQELCDNKDNNCDGVLNPQWSPCFSDPGSLTCSSGYRACEGGILADSCNIAATIPLDTNWCDSYQTCEEEPEIADPFQCTVAVAQELDSVVCQVNLLESGTLCTGTITLLSLSSLAADVPGVCSYIIPGGGHQQGYQLSLGKLMNPIEAQIFEVGACEARMRASLFPDKQWPATASIPLQFTDKNGDVSTLSLEMHPHIVDSCDGLRGFSCNGMGFTTPGTQ